MSDTTTTPRLGQKVSAWKMGKRATQSRIVGTYQGLAPNGFAIVKTGDGEFKVRLSSVRVEA